jgi:putative ABC transport system permease protein
MEETKKSRESRRSALIVAKMAFRNLSRHKKATFLLGGVIGFGIMIISLMQGCAGSLMGNVSSNFANMMGGHIFVSGTEKLPSGKEYTIIRDDAVLLDALKASKVETKSISKLAEFQATLVFEGNSSMQAVLGVDFERDSFITERLVVASGSFANMSDKKGIVVSEKMAKALKARQGDRILAQLRTFSGQQNLGEFTIAAVVKDAGLFSLASMSAYANISYVNELLNLPPGSYQTLSLYLPDMRKLDAMGAAYYAALKERAQVFDRKNASDERADMMARLRGGKVETWEGVRYKLQTLNDRLSGVQDLVNGINIASLIALTVLFLIIMVGISNTFRMIMLDRIKEIGTMRALGMQKTDVLSLFLDEAIFLALGGAVAGLVLALLVMLGFSFYDFGLGSFLSIVLRNGHLTFSLSPLLVGANILIIAGLTFLAALFPARAAAALEPANALRTSK